MREIKFRGKSLKTGEWIYGFYLKGFEYVDDHVIIPLGGYMIPVDPKTVGQLTPLEDIDGDDIWEGDIIGFGDDSPSCKTGMYGSLGSVMMCTDTAKWAVKLSDGRSVTLADHKLFSNGETCRKVYGNIHDNPELLDSGNE